MTREEAIAVALASPNREVCGLVIGDEWVQITNLAKGNDVFIMDMGEVVEAMVARGNRLDGLWHSHPDGDPDPSPADEHHHPAGKMMYIITLPDGEVHEYA